MTDYAILRDRVTRKIERHGSSPREPLTLKQRAIYDFIEAYIRDSRVSPTFSEIAAHFGFRALSTVHEHLMYLRHRGWIRVRPYSARGITLREPAEPSGTPCPRCGYLVDDRPLSPARGDAP